MTEQEKEELKFKAVCIDASSDFLADYDELLWWVEAKKKEWQDKAYEDGKEDADFNNHVENDLRL